MSKIHQSKVSMHAVQSLADSGASQGARRTTEDAPESASPPVMPATNSEVVASARRRCFSNATKHRILEAVDRYTQPDELGYEILDFRQSHNACVILNIAGIAWARQYLRKRGVP